MKISDDLKQVINIAQSLAKEFSNAEFSPGHLLKALLHKDIELTELLMALDQDIYYLEEWAEVRIESSTKTGNVPENPSGDKGVKAVFREAENISLKLSKDENDPVSVLTALCTPGVGFNYEQLKTFTLTQKQILDFLMKPLQLRSQNRVRKWLHRVNCLALFCRLHFG